MCLQRWVDEKQRGNSTAKVLCPQCNTEYLIIFPKLGGSLDFPRIVSTEALGTTLLYDSPVADPKILNRGTKDNLSALSSFIARLAFYTEKGGFLGKKISQ